MCLSSQNHSKSPPVSFGNATFRYDFQCFRKTALSARPRKYLRDQELFETLLWMLQGDGRSQILRNLLRDRFPFPIFLPNQFPLKKTETPSRNGNLEDFSDFNPIECASTQRKNIYETVSLFFFTNLRRRKFISKSNFLLDFSVFF